MKRIFLFVFLCGLSLYGSSQNSVTDSLFSNAIRYYGQHMERGTFQWIYTNSSVADSFLSLIQEVIDNPGDSTLVDDAKLLKLWIKASFSNPNQMDYQGCLSIVDDLSNNYSSSTSDQRTLHLTVILTLNGNGYEGPMGFLFQDIIEATKYLHGLIHFLGSAYGLAQDENESAIEFKNYYQAYPNRPLTYKAKFDYCPIGLNISTPEERIALYKDIIENNDNIPLRNLSLSALYSAYGDPEKDYVRNYVSQHADNYAPFETFTYYPYGNYTHQQIITGQVSIAVTGNATPTQEMYLDSTIAMYNELLSFDSVHITKVNPQDTVPDIAVEFNYPEYGGQYNNGNTEWTLGDGIAIAKTNGYYYGGKIQIFNCGSDSLKEILNHEFGHAIGLGHSYFPEDLMFFGGKNDGLLSHTDSIAIIHHYSIPKILSVSSSPVFVAIPGTANVLFQANVQDPEGASDITGVWIDLSAIGGSNQEPMNPTGNGLYQLTWALSESVFVTPLYNYAPNIIIYAKDQRGNINWKKLSEVRIVCPPTPVIINIENKSTLSGETNCYNATQTINVAGNGTTCIVQNDGSVTMIAGERISYLPGTKVWLGGFLLGYIAPSGPWCQSPSMPLVTTEEEKATENINSSMVTIYPNPTTGMLTVEVKGEPLQDHINIDGYSIWGEKISSEVMNSGTKREISLSDRPAGVYFFRVTVGKKTETVKIIKQ